MAASQNSEIVFDVVDLAEQEVEVRASGENVLCLEENAHAYGGDPDTVRPDIVQVFCDCAGLGMFCGAAYAPAYSAARLLTKNVDIEGRVQVWRLGLRGLEGGAFRVLLNLLRAMELERIEVATVGRPPGGPAQALRLDFRALSYPRFAEPFPFTLDYEPPRRSQAPRRLLLAFAQELDDQLVETACSALRSWSLLLALGGFAPGGLEPRDSGALPQTPIPYDAFTIEQAFDIFLCDEAAFHAILSWAIGRHGPDFPLAEVSIE